MLIVYDFLEMVVFKKPSAPVIGLRQGEKMVGCFEVNKISRMIVIGLGRGNASVLCSVKT